MIFTIHPENWYAMECVFPSAERHFSPIWVREARALKTGQGRIEVGFFHANYTEGVRDKIYELKILHRGTGYIVAIRMQDSGAGNTAIILEAITERWLRRHFPELRVDCVDGAPVASDLDRATARLVSA